MKNHRHEIRAVSDEEAEVWLYGEIGPDFWGDGSRIDAKTFATELAELDVERISLRINSPGGSVSHGQAIFNALKRHSAHVTSCIDGIAASIAGVIALAADEVVMAENALFMVHQPVSGICGFFSAAELRKEADVTDKFAETIIGVYERRTGMTADEIAALMDAETWYTAEEALAAGFVDRVSDDGNVSASARDFDLAAYGFRNLPEALRERAAQAAAEPAAAPPDPPPPAPAGDSDDTLTARAVQLLTMTRNGGR